MKQRFLLSLQSMLLVAALYAGNKDSRMSPVSQQVSRHQYSIDSLVDKPTLVEWFDANTDNIFAAYILTRMIQEMIPDLLLPSNEYFEDAFEGAYMTKEYENMGVYFHMLRECASKNIHSKNFVSIIEMILKKANDSDSTTGLTRTTLFDIVEKEYEPIHKYFSEAIIFEAIAAIEGDLGIYILRFADQNKEVAKCFSLGIDHV